MTDFNALVEAALKAKEVHRLAYEAQVKAAEEALQRPDIRAFVRMPDGSPRPYRTYDNDAGMYLTPDATYGWDWAWELPKDMPADAEGVGTRLYHIEQDERAAALAYGDARLNLQHALGALGLLDYYPGRG